MNKLVFAASVATYLSAVGPIFAQGVPVTDAANTEQAAITANNTASIMNSSSQILTQVTQTLQAVTGTRQTGTLSSAALGNGFSMGSAPDLGSIMAGGQMSWGNLGSYGQTATTILNGLNLVKSLTGSSDSTSLTGADKAFQQAVNVTAALTGTIQGTQASAQTRTQSFQQAATQIGTATDIKGSIDQNSQLQVQTGLTINEMIGVLNQANAALNAQQSQELAAQAQAARFFKYDASSASLVTK